MRSQLFRRRSAALFRRNERIAFKTKSHADAIDERTKIFDEMKHLYKARSDAVHSRVLPPKSKVDLDLADQLVVRVVQAILQRGSFPDWTSLTLGGEG